ncbi:MAG: DegV family protein [Lachnospiraceae bacterium]|nr:DegV family protein [Candidatus Merdinaster equi]
MSYVLSACSTADLTIEHFAKRNIEFVSFHLTLDGVPYVDDLGKSISSADFYRAMVNGAETRTSQVNVEEYMDFFEGFLKQGKDILHLTLSSGISGSYNSAILAMNDLKEKYPEREIYVVDSLCASSGYGLLMDKLADLRDEGMSVGELAAWAEENRKYVNHWFFSTDLTFYIKGGRVSKVSGFFGTVLNICPVLNVNDEGKLIPRIKARGKKKAYQVVLDRMLELADKGRNYDDKVYISNSACYEDAKIVADMVEEAFPLIKGKVEIYDIGTTIGAHTGPGTVALFFWGKEREK